MWDPQKIFSRKVLNIEENFKEKSKFRDSISQLVRANLTADRNWLADILFIVAFQYTRLKILYMKIYLEKHVCIDKNFIFSNHNNKKIFSDRSEG
jgi:hypothetical protein